MPHLREHGHEALRDDDQRVVGAIALARQVPVSGEARAIDVATLREKPVPASALPCRLRTRPAS